VARRPPGGRALSSVVVRLLLRLVVVLAVLFGMLLLGTELLARPFAERAVARQIRDDRGLATTPDVDLVGFPFLFAVAKGHLDRATVDIDGYVVDGLLVRRAGLDLDGVGFSVAELVSGNADVTAERATLTAEVTAADLNTWLATRGIAATVAFTGGTVQVAGRVEAEGLSGEVQAEGAVSVSDGTLRLDPTSVLVGGVEVPPALVDVARAAVGFSVPLPEVAGVTVTSVVVGDGAATLTADVSDYLVAGEAG
jgi:hypothetical protein